MEALGMSLGKAGERELGYEVIRLNRSLSLALIGVTLALSAVLSVIGFQMPMGGRASLEMLPLLYMCWLEPRVGVYSAFLYGVLKLFLEGFIMHPLQVLLDYPLAFGALSVASMKFFRRSRTSFILGATLGVVLRWLAHVVSGAVFFASLVKAGNPWLYSIIYNSLYLLPSWAITLLVLYPLLDMDGASILSR